MTTGEIFNQLCAQFNPKFAARRDAVLWDAGQALLFGNDEEESVRRILMRSMIEARTAPRETPTRAILKPTSGLDAFLGVSGRL